MSKLTDAQIKSFNAKQQAEYWDEQQKDYLQKAELELAAMRERIEAIEIGKQHQYDLAQKAHKEAQDVLNKLKRNNKIYNIIRIIILVCWVLPLIHFIYTYFTSSCFY